MMFAGGVYVSNDRNEYFAKRNKELYDFIQAKVPKKSGIKKMCLEAAEKMPRKSMEKASVANFIVEACIRYAHELGVEPIPQDETEDTEN